MQQAFGLTHIDGLVDRDEVFMGHQFGDFLLRIGGKANVPVGQNANQLSVAASVVAGLDNRNAGNLVVRHDLKCFSQFCGWRNCDRIDHHAGFELLHLCDLIRLFFRRKVAVNDTHATSLRHCDGKARFCDRIHRRRKYRDVQGQAARHTGRGIDLIGQNFGWTGAQQDVVKRQRRFSDHISGFRGHAPTSWCGISAAKRNRLCVLPGWQPSLSPLYRHGKQQNCDMMDVSTGVAHSGG